MQLLPQILLLAATLTLFNSGKAHATAQVAASASAHFKSEDQKMAYALGLSMARSIEAHLKAQQQLGIALPIEALLGGIQEGLSNRAKLDEAETQAVMKTLAQQLDKLATDKKQREAALQGEQGQQFRQHFSSQKGVIKTDSGLLYWVEKEGTGDKPKESDTVVVHYRGTLTDGTQFDSSYSRAEPTTFPLNRVIPGWIEGLQQIKKGGKIKLVVPPQLAYGNQDVPGIPANATLIFEIELLDINPVVNQKNDQSKPKKGKGTPTKAATTSG